MAEFERSRVIDVPRETVFAVANDPDRLAEWLPEGVDVEPHDDGTVTATGEVVPDAPRDGLLGGSPDQLRMEWGSRGDGRYAGWLQVMEAGPQRSEAVIHLSFLGDQPQAHFGTEDDRVVGMLDEALDRLADLATARADA